MKALTALVLVLLFAVPAHARIDDRDLHSHVDRRALPLLNIYNPETQQNEDPRSFSFEELEHLLSVPRFRKWNDIEKVCQDMQIMFGRVGSECNSYSLTPHIPPARGRAYFSREQPIPQIIVPAPRVITITDPLTPPWSPAFQWYGPRGPYRGSHSW